MVNQGFLQRQGCADVPGARMMQWLLSQIGEEEYTVVPQGTQVSVQNLGRSGGVCERADVQEPCERAPGLREESGVRRAWRHGRTWEECDHARLSVLGGHGHMGQACKGLGETAGGECKCGRGLQFIWSVHVRQDECARGPGSQCKRAQNVRAGLRVGHKPGRA